MCGFQSFRTSGSVHDLWSLRRKNIGTALCCILILGHQIGPSFLRGSSITKSSHVIVETAQEADLGSRVLYEEEWLRPSFHSYVNRLLLAVSLNLSKSRIMAWIRTRQCFLNGPKNELLLDTYTSKDGSDNHFNPPVELGLLPIAIDIFESFLASSEAGDFSQCFPLPFMEFHPSTVLAAWLSVFFIARSALQKPRLPKKCRTH